MTASHPPTTIETMRQRAAASGIRSVNVITFRDRDDATAGGSEEHAYWMCRYLTLAGIEVTLHTGAVPGAPSEVVRDGYRVVRRGGPLTVLGTSVWDYWLRRMGPCDGVIEIFHGAPFFVPLWSRKPHVAIVHHVHLGTWPVLQPGVLGRVGDALERYGTRLVYRHRPIVAPSRSTRDEVIRNYRSDPALTFAAPNGVAERFSPGGRRSERPLVVAVARFMPQKRLDELIRILADVRTRVPDLEAAIIGDGQERPKLEALAAELGCTDWLRLPGRVDDAELVDWYRRAWVVASTSLREGFGLTLTEAGACGTPAVATRMSGHIDAVEDGVSGLLADDFAELTDALVAVLTDHALRARLSEGALKHTRQFSWEAATAVVLDALCDDADRVRARQQRRQRRLGGLLRRDPVRP